MAKTAPWFSLHITHNYYEEGDCPGLEVSLSEESERQLRNHRCFWKEELGQLTVHASLTPDGSGPTIPFPAAGLTLEIFLWRATRHFESFTELPPYQKSSEMLEARGAIGEPLSLAAVPRSAVSARPGFFARLYIHVPTQPMTGWPMRATLPLEAATATWKYFFITEAHLSAPEVNDTTNTLGFQPVIAPDLDQEPLVAKLKAKYPEAAHILYRSTDPVRWRESRYAGIQMLRDGHLIIDNLRNPSWETSGVEIINALPNH